MRDRGLDGQRGGGFGGIQCDFRQREGHSHKRRREGTETKLQIMIQMLNMNNRVCGIRDPNYQRVQSVHPNSLQEG